MVGKINYDASESFGAHLLQSVKVYIPRFQRSSEWFHSDVLSLLSRDFVMEQFSLWNLVITPY